MTGSLSRRTHASNVLMSSVQATRASISSIRVPTPRPWSAGAMANRISARSGVPVLR